MLDSDLYDALDGVGAARFEAVVYRHIGRDRDCRSGEGARAFGGRWNPPGSFPTLYTSLTPTGAGAELRRLAERQNRRVEDLLPRTLCNLHVSLARVIDLRKKETLKRVGVLLTDDAEGLIASQTVGHAAHQLGFEGLLTPSIAGNYANLVVFELNITGESRLEEAGRTVWHVLDDVP